VADEESDSRKEAGEEGGTMNGIATAVEGFGAAVAR